MFSILSFQVQDVEMGGCDYCETENFICRPISTKIVAKNNFLCKVLKTSQRKSYWYKYMGCIFWSIGGLAGLRKNTISAYIFGYTVDSPNYDLPSCQKKS